MTSSMQPQGLTIEQLQLRLQIERTQNFKERLELQKAKQKLELVNKWLRLASEQQVGQRFIQQVADTTPSILYVHDLIEKRNIYMNRAVTSVLGYSRKEIQRMGTALVQQLWHPDDIELIRQHYQKCATLQDNEVLEIEFRVRDCRSEWHWLRSRDTVFFRTPDGRPRQILGTAEDISLRKQTEESQIQLIKAKQEELNRLKSSFISMVRREVRIPLTTILSSSETLEQIFGDSLGKQQSFSQLKEAAQHISRLLENMLVIDSRESQQQQVKTTRFDALRFIYSVGTELQNNRGNKNRIVITSHGKSNWVELDKKLLHQILSNLLKNAIRYSPGNTPICVRFTRFPGKAVFQVQDQGIGIPQHDIQHLFEYFRRDSSSGQTFSTGLGLAIVKQCVDLHKGEITVHSVVGRGTTFTVMLPQKD